MPNIAFAPPQINNEDIEAVVAVLRSGWITTGPVTKQFESEICTVTQAKRFVALNSATAALELALRYFGVGEGDEVIVPAYTYSASAAVVCHTGAKVVMVDVNEEDFNLDIKQVEQLITCRTKAIIAVDIAGLPSNYSKLLNLVAYKQSLFKAHNSMQELLGRILVIADAAHSLGATYKNSPSGNVADLTAFSFHAVKNITTAEGGGLALAQHSPFMADEFYQTLQLLSLHGQNKDALSKSRAGAWQYDIMLPGFKCNLTDMAAALGLSQLKRYPNLLARRRELANLYTQAFSNDSGLIVPIFSDNERESSYHLYLLRIACYTEEQRNELIRQMSQAGISCNVHYKPLPSFTAYQKLGFMPENYPQAYNNYRHLISLPLHTGLSNGDVDYVATTLKKLYKNI
jgi:dTDP-4-amino-4,6-dideoxygalactose transaminase